MHGELGKLVAATIGVALCLAALATWALPTSGSPPGLDLRLIAVPPGELIVDPTGVVTAARAMQAGDAPVGGEVWVENIAGRPLLVHLVALPSAMDLGRKVRLRAVAGDRTLATGSLASLTRPGGPGVRLPVRGSAQIEVSAWIEPGESGYRGGILDVTLDLRAEPLGAAR